MNWWALHFNIITLSYLHIECENIFVTFNTIFVTIISGSAEYLYKLKGGYIWELVIHAAVARAGHVLFFQIPLKLCICTKALLMGISLPHWWRVRNKSWGADLQQVSQHNAGDDKNNYRILTVIFNQTKQIRILYYNLYSSTLMHTNVWITKLLRGC